MSRTRDFSRNCSRAQAAGKIARDYRIPDAFRHNTPERLEQALEPHRGAGLFSEYPFGTDLTPEEIALAKALRRLKAETGTWPGRARTFARALASSDATAAELLLLRRLGLDRPDDARARLLRRLVLQALRRRN
ncbi:MAG: hypothetical protein ACRETT_15565 [Steroidobacteraceae bacterium]